MPAIFTTANRVHNLIKLRDESNLFLALGKYQTEWDDSENPPTPLVTQTEVEELIYIKKITVKHAIVDEDPYDAYSASVTINGVDYDYVDDDDTLYDDLVLKLYVSAQISFDDIAPTDTTYRQVGILLNPKDSSGNLLTDGEYLAADVADQGQLIYVGNFIGVTRDDSQQEKFDIIVNF
jgi:hypothetical protein